jgi:putative chitobiose transport system permease protein
MSFNVRTALHYALLIAIALLCVFPFLWTLSTAIGTEGNVFSFPSSFVPHRPSFDNFIEVFRDRSRPLLLEFDLITFWTVAWTVLVCSLAAYPLARYRFRGRGLVFTVIIATLMLPTEVNFSSISSRQRNCASSIRTSG